MVMSRSGFSYSAAYTALPRRAAWLDKVRIYILAICWLVLLLLLACCGNCLHEADGAIRFKTQGSRSSLSVPTVPHATHCCLVAKVSSQQSLPRLQNEDDCTFIDYDGKCLGMACPGQMGDSHFARAAWNFGPYESEGV